MSTATERRKAMQDQMVDRTKESHTRAQNSGGYKTIFNPAKMEGVTQWKCGEGEHLMAMIPYEVGENDPHTKKGNFQYVLEVRVHSNVGPNNDNYLCLTANYNQPCPICEDRERKMDTGDYSGEENKEKWKKEIGPMRPKQRVIYNIVCYDTDKEENKGVQVFEASHYLMEAHIEKITKNPRKGGVIAFADPSKEGRDLAFEREGTGATNTKYIGHRLVEREEDITDDILDQARCLDELLLIPTYEEILQASTGKSKEKPASEEKEQKQESSPDKQEKAGKQEEKVEEKVEETKTSEKQEEKAEEESSSSSGNCPSGHTFGADIDTKPECNDCVKWDDCAAAADVLENS